MPIMELAIKKRVNLNQDAVLILENENKMIPDLL